MPTFLRVFGKVNFQLFYQSMDLLRRVITFLKIKTNQDFEGTPLLQQASLRTHGCVGEETWEVLGKPMPLLPAELTLSMWEIPRPHSVPTRWSQCFSALFLEPSRASFATRGAKGPVYHCPVRRRGGDSRPSVAELRAEEAPCFLAFCPQQQLPEPLDRLTPFF